jgi:hypothetical protein
MPFWAWAGLLVLLSYSAFRVLRACRLGASSWGPFVYDRKGAPFTFWMLTAVDIVCFGFMAFLLCAAILKQALGIAIVPQT